MNERIKEIAIEAGIISAEYNGFDPTGLTTAQRKFAELIVRECAEQIDLLKAQVDRKLIEATFQQASDKIKEHFGVEL